MTDRLSILAGTMYPLAQPPLKHIIPITIIFLK